jgi:tetratricopeptide (TPR) repeat protein
LRNSYHHLGLADRALERAGDLSGNDSALLAGVAQQFLYDLDYGKAAKFYERLLNLVPSTWENFVICRHCATCLRKIGRPEEAANIIVTAIESCRLAATRAEGEGLELIKLGGIAAASRSRPLG